MLLVLYFIDKVKRFRLSREAKNKAEKNRSKVQDAFWKSIHAAKAEKAQEERERKRRELKERIREIEDPDRQRKYLLSILYDKSSFGNHYFLKELNTVRSCFNIFYFPLLFSIAIIHFLWTAGKLEERELRRERKKAAPKMKQLKVKAM